MKKCSKCGSEKPVSEFCKNKNEKDGLAVRCRPCHRAASLAWYFANKEKARITDRDRYWRDKEKRNKLSREYRQNNLEERRAKDRAYNKKRYAENPESVRAKTKRWADKFPEKVKALQGRMNAARRARLASATGSHTNEQRTELYASYLGMCAYCFSEKATHLDHVVPLARGGTNDIDNLVPACAKCNQSKGARSLLAFMVRKVTSEYGTANLVSGG